MITAGLEPANLSRVGGALYQLSYAIMNKGQDLNLLTPVGAWIHLQPLNVLGDGAAPPTSAV